MRLGEMLVRDGRATPQQLETAAAHQKRVGGRFGTILVELGYVDADAIAVYLGLELGIPIATRAVLDRAKRAAVRLLTPAHAEQLLCVPVVVQDRDLIVAVRDPHDLEVLDRLSSVTGYRVIPRVAPDIFLYYYVERYYGVPRPDRFRAMDQAVFHRRPGGDEAEPPPLPLPGLPPPVATPVAPPTRAQPLSARTQAQEDAELAKANALAKELEDDKGATAEKAATLDGPERFQAAPAAAMAAGTPEPASKSLSADEALAAMNGATSRGEVAAALIGYATERFDVAVLLIVREGLAIGWRGFGPDVDQDRLETLLVPLEPASMFRAAIEQKDLFVGPAAPTALHAHLFKVLRTSAPRHAVVFPIAIGERIVNLLYAQKQVEAELSDDDRDELRRLGQAAGAAYVRLIAHKKKR